MTKLADSQFTIRLPSDLVIKLELEKETYGIKSRAKMIEKCLRYYFENKIEEEDLKKEVESLRNEIEKIKEKIYLV